MFSPTARRAISSSILRSQTSPASNPTPTARPQEKNASKMERLLLEIPPALDFTDVIAKLDLSAVGSSLSKTTSPRNGTRGLRPSKTNVRDWISGESKVPPGLNLSSNTTGRDRPRSDIDSKSGGKRSTGERTTGLYTGQRGDRATGTGGQEINQRRSPDTSNPAYTRNPALARSSTQAGRELNQTSATHRQSPAFLAAPGSPPVNSSFDRSQTPRRNRDDSNSAAGQRNSSWHDRAIGGVPGAGQGTFRAARDSTGRQSRSSSGPKSSSSSTTASGQPSPAEVFTPLTTNAIGDRAARYVTPESIELDRARSKSPTTMDLFGFEDAELESEKTAGSDVARAEGGGAKGVRSVKKKAEESGGKVLDRKELRALIRYDAKLRNAGDVSLHIPHVPTAGTAPSVVDLSSFPYAALRIASPPTSGTAISPPTLFSTAQSQPASSTSVALANSTPEQIKRLAAFHADWILSRNGVTGGIGTKQRLVVIDEMKWRLGLSTRAQPSNTA